MASRQKTAQQRYNHPSIKSALVEETHGKCAYCESKLRHVTYGDVEHIVPKSIDPTHSFDWDNLTLACDLCNTNKGQFHGDHSSFIDPYTSDPEEHFWQLGAMVYAKPGCDAAWKTERLLQLNRPELIEKRKEKINYLVALLGLAERTDDQDLKELIIADFHAEETRPDREYAALARDIARRFRPT